MTEQTPEREDVAPLAADGEEREFVGEGGDQRELVDEHGDNVVEKVAGEDEFTASEQPSVAPTEDDVAMPRPGGLVQ